MDNETVVNDMGDFAFYAIMDRITGHDSMEKKADDGLVDNMLFKFMPLALFGGPFLAGGLHYLVDRELNEQEAKHKVRMKKLKNQFGDYIDAARGK